ncbi:MAG: ABC transporter ATP-binding protein [Butyrivibrio sp.]|nr:ABC transporter ATP-binding protein [Butyrivibrio sp.]
MSGELVVKNLRKNMGDFILGEISFKAYPGEILGIIGENGSGKTSLIRTILGAYKPEKNDGFIKLGDIDSYEKPKEYKRELAYVLEESVFNPSMKSEEIGKLYGKYYDGFDMTKYKKLLEEYGISLTKKIFDLSKGQKIRHQIAFAMSYDASCYIFDEPTGNLDVDFRDEFYDLMRKIVEDEKNMVIYATHLVDELERIADRILWMDGGVVKFYGSLDELKDGFRIVEAADSILSEIPPEMVVKKALTGIHSEAMVDMRKGNLSEELMGYTRMAELREIMYYSQTSMNED